MLSIKTPLANGLLAATAMGAFIKRQYVNPGVVTSDTGIHDPKVVKTPSGIYIAVYTGANN
jgi:arabinan endo-1,5-alpha-L-arabinosidase